MFLYVGRQLSGDFLILCGVDAHRQFMVNVMIPDWSVVCHFCIMLLTGVYESEIYTPASNMKQI
jgi:hypothetical protein